MFKFNFGVFILVFGFPVYPSVAASAALSEELGDRDFFVVAQLAEGISPECQNVDFNSAESLVGCIATIRSKSAHSRFKRMHSNDCSIIIRVLFNEIGGGNYLRNESNPIPSCDTIAKVSKILTGEEPSWAACTGYPNPNKKAHMTKCMSVFPKAYHGRAYENILGTCSKFQRTYKIALKKSLERGLPKGYKPPECVEVIEVVASLNEEQEAGNIPLAEGISPECQNVDFDSAESLLSCMKTIRFTSGENRFRRMHRSDCSSAIRKLFKEIGQKRYLHNESNPIPSCETIAKVSKMLTGEEPYWIACAGYPNPSKKAHLTKCMSAFPEAYHGPGYENKIGTCSQFQRTYKIALKKALERGLPSGYTPPECGEVNEVIASLKQEQEQEAERIRLSEEARRQRDANEKQKQLERNKEKSNIIAQTKSGNEELDAAADKLTAALTREDELGQSTETETSPDREACQQGAAESCYLYGRTLVQARNREEGMNYYSMACDGGIVDACSGLGAYFYSGKFIQKDLDKAVDAYEKACDLGSPDGCNISGIIHYRDEYKRIDFVRARKNFDRSCKLGLIPSCVSFANMLAKGQGGARNLSQAISLSEKACETGGGWIGCDKVKIYKTEAYFESIDADPPKKCQSLASNSPEPSVEVTDFEWDKLFKEQALAACKAATEQNASKENHYWRGHVLYRSKSFAEAMSMYEKSAHQGYIPAQYAYASMLFKGPPAMTDWGKAMIWFEKAASSGHPEAQTDLGYIYQSGQGVKTDYEEARKWYRRSAEQGESQGQYNLAELYFNGTGVRKDEEIALEWARKAAAQQHVDAIELVAHIESGGLYTGHNSKHPPPGPPKGKYWCWWEPYTVWYQDDIFGYWNTKSIEKDYCRKGPDYKLIVTEGGLGARGLFPSRCADVQGWCD